MLTPRINDKNREAELRRKELQPRTFASCPETMELAKKFKDSGLVGLDNKPLINDPRGDK